MTTVADTGFAVALGNQRDQYHVEVKRVYAKQNQILLPQTVMAIAERYNLDTVLTLDRRDFSIYQPSHCPAFILLP
ncbi:MAG: hypothetical protein AAFQ95_25265 [Cyanobacteria bacterium J06621_3]